MGDINLIGCFPSPYTENQIILELNVLNSKKKKYIELLLNLTDSAGNGALIRTNENNEAYMTAVILKEEFRKQLKGIVDNENLTPKESDLAIKIANYCYTQPQF